MEVDEIEGSRAEQSDSEYQGNPPEVKQEVQPQGEPVGEASAETDMLALQAFISNTSHLVGDTSENPNAV
eukprot:m.135604 g.135604  ORF g.135604 m.135604 type:complete len:70 (-) comp14714_c0_seq1:56-265(-)